MQEIYEENEKLALQNAGLTGLIQDAQAEIAHLTDELAALRAGQDALVAAAYEAAADYCWRKRDLLADAEKQQITAGLTGRDYYGRRLEAELLSKALRALTPSDATAALETKLRAERNKARREAADRTLGLATGHECRNAILAMIEPEGK